MKVVSFYKPQESLEYAAYRISTLLGNPAGGDTVVNFEALIHELLAYEEDLQAEIAALRNFAGVWLP